MEHGHRAASGRRKNAQAPTRAAQQRTVRRPRSTGEAAAANTWYTAPYTALSDAEDTITNQSPNAPWSRRVTRATRESGWPR